MAKDLSHSQLATEQNKRHDLPCHLGKAGRAWGHGAVRDQGTADKTSPWGPHVGCSAMSVSASRAWERPKGPLTAGQRPHCRGRTEAPTTIHMTSLPSSHQGKKPDSKRTGYTAQTTQDGLDHMGPQKVETHLGGGGGITRVHSQQTSPNRTAEPESRSTMCKVCLTKKMNFPRKVFESQTPHHPSPYLCSWAHGLWTAHTTAGSTRRLNAHPPSTPACDPLPWPRSPTTHTPNPPRCPCSLTQHPVLPDPTVATGHPRMKPRIYSSPKSRRVRLHKHHGVFTRAATTLQQANCTLM